MMQTAPNNRETLRQILIKATTEVLESLERFRTAAKYADRPAAADIAFCVAAYANGMAEDRIACALEDDYLSRCQSFKACFLHPQDNDKGKRLG